MNLLIAGGIPMDLPMFDPYVAGHVNNPASLVPTLIEQINGGMYAQFFKDKTGLTFLDIGANAGLVSIYASDSCARIIALEPAPDTFRVLQAMTAGRPNIEPIRAALAPVDGTVDFYVNDINSTASSTVNTYGAKTTVPAMKLSSILRIFQLTRVDVCKVDCEGAEGESLSFDELKSAAPIVQQWYIETHNCPKSTWQEKMGRLVEYLTRIGYYRMAIDGMTLTASKP